MKHLKLTTACVVLASSVALTSCIGSFGLTNKVLAWNKQLTNNNFVNELIFIGLHIVPVYEVSVLADALVINSIEFWTGDNPVAVGTVKEVKGENGKYLVTTTKEGYTITKEGEEAPIELKFDEKAQSWNVISNGESYEIMKMNGNGTVDLNMQNGSYMNVNMDAQGVMAARRTIMGDTFFAAR